MSARVVSLVLSFFQNQVFPQGFSFLQGSLFTLVFPRAAAVLRLNVAFGVGEVQVRSSVKLTGC